uniref:Uncharacterized protein n=1 Tax=Oryza punctata TaxID=4537 RepID=A0A0E0JYS5_ORYPU
MIYIYLPEGNSLERRTNRSGIQPKAEIRVWEEREWDGRSLHLEIDQTPRWLGVAREHPTIVRSPNPPSLYPHRRCGPLPPLHRSRPRRNLPNTVSPALLLRAVYKS